MKVVPCPPVLNDTGFMCIHHPPSFGANKETCTLPTVPNLQLKQERAFPHVSHIETAYVVTHYNFRCESSKKTYIRVKTTNKANGLNWVLFLYKGILYGIGSEHGFNLPMPENFAILLEFPILISESEQPYIKVRTDLNLVDRQMPELGIILSEVQPCLLKGPAFLICSNFSTSLQHSAAGLYSS